MNDIDPVDLINLETDKFILNIKGKPAHPRVEQTSNLEGRENKARLQIDPVNCSVQSFQHYHPEIGQQEYRDELVFPFFYEEQDYQVYIEGKNGITPEFYHENRHLRQAVSPMPGRGNILWGNINFRSDVGYSELEIRDKTGTIFVLKIEVFPTKIDYRDDYYNLLNEVNQEVYNLAYDFLRRTFQGMELKEVQDVTDVEFFSILQTIFDDFLQAFKRVQKSPYHHLKKIRRVLPAARVKRIDRKSIKWLRKNPEAYNQEAGIPFKMQNIDKQISYDNFENKFVKWIISQLIKKITIFKRKYLGALRDEDNADERVLNQANRMVKQLDYLLQHTFLKGVGDLHKLNSLSLVLQMAPGYKEIYRYYLMLLKGLSLEGELFRLSMKQVWKLYEYWCFLKLNRILRDDYTLLKSNLIDFDYSGIYVTLNTSREARVKYKNSKTGEIFYLSYNTTEGEGVTTAQRPDNILSLIKEKSDTQYKFIFDAKYRINPAYPGSDYAGKYRGIPGPEEDTINTMHRYRDAITSQIEGNFRRTMVGAYVLFPYHDQGRYRDHKFYRSIEKVNVGAFPFLPGSTDLVTEFLDNIINESAVSNYERNVMPGGTDEFRPQKEFVQNVIVGSLGKREQLSFLLVNDIYYMPHSESVLEHGLEYVALYQSQNKFPGNSGIKYYGEIEEIKTVRRKQIDFPTQHSPEDWYLLFRLKQWNQLAQPIKPEGYGVSSSHIYTNDLLLKRSETLPELSIDNFKEWRVWLELKRIKQEIKFKMESQQIGEVNGIEGFTDGDISVKIKGNSLVCRGKDEEAVYEYREFLRNPRVVLKSLFTE